MRDAPIFAVLMLGCLQGPRASLVKVQKLRPRSGGTYDSGAVGNLAGNTTLAELRETRNHAMVAAMEIGSPPQVLSCMLDSGSADLWVPSFRCDSCDTKDSEQKGLFHAERSATFSPVFVQTAMGVVPQMVQVVYGGGTLGGFAVHDTVTLGQVTVANQTFLLAEEVDLEAFRSRPWNGVCGLGWRSLARTGLPLYTMLSKAGVPAIFTLVPEGSPDDPAIFAVGMEPPAAEIQGAISWAPAMEPLSFWIVAGSVVQPPGVVTATSISASGTVTPARFLVDTGTTFLLVPPRKYFDLVRELFPETVFDRFCGIDPKAGNVVFCACSVLQYNKRGLGTGEAIVFELGGARFTLTLDDLLVEVPASSLGGPKGETVCELQVQRRPRASSALAAALGEGRHRDGNGAHRRRGSHRRRSQDFGAPLGAPVEPFSITMSSTPLVGQRTAGKTSPKAPKGVPAWAHLPGGGGAQGSQGAATEEVLVQSMGDGVVCEIEVVRAEDGSILKSSAKAMDSKTGKDLPEQDSACLKDWQERPGWVTRTGDAPDGVPSVDEDPVSEKDDDEADEDDTDDLWVLGDVFLRRHVVVFDFDHRRLGVAHPAKEISKTSPAAAAPREKPLSVAGGDDAAAGQHQHEPLRPEDRLADAPGSVSRTKKIASATTPLATSMVLLPVLVGSALAALAGLAVYGLLVRHGQRLEQASSVREGSAFLRGASASEFAAE